MVNNRWARLSQAEKAELLGIYTSKGYTDLAKIIADYNSYASGGYVSNSATYKSDAYLYNSPVDEGAPITVPLKYEPLPHYGDYEYPTSTGMVDSMPIVTPSFDVMDNHIGVSTGDMTTSSISTLDPIADAAARIRAVENSKDNKDGGWDPKTKRWYPHRSHEGGADTIAYGIKLSNGTPEAALALKQGYLTDEQAESALDSLARKYYDAAKRVYDGRYGEGEWDKLSDKSQSILVDYSYNPGLTKFPNLMEGFHSGNIDMIRNNYKRYSNGKPLGRNKTLLEEIDTLGNQYPIFRAEGGNLFSNGGNTENLNEIRPGESIAQWKRRITKKNTSRRSLFNKEKVLNRVAGDAHTFDDSNGGVTSAVLQYLFNDDDFVNNRIKTAELGAKKYRDVLTSGDYGLIYRTFRDLPKDEQKIFDAGRMEIPIKQHEDAKRIYLGYPPKYGTMEPSKYRPTIGKSESPYQVNPLMTDSEFNNLILPLYTQWKTGVGPEVPIMSGYLKIGNKHAPRVEDVGNVALARNLPYISDATISEGFDKNGQYISLYDVWDYNTNVLKTPGDNIGKWIGGKPFDIYQRYYLDDWLDIPEGERGNPYIAPSYIEAQKANGSGLFANGGKIHIKPGNRGKFTALKERTGHSASWFKAHGTPAQKKMAVFELNSRRWNHKHSDGGSLFSDIHDIF